MKILCLGASGFIGSHLTKRLLDEGHTLVGVDIYQDKIQEFIGHERLTFIHQDIRNPNWDLDAFVANADLVIDLIAYANPGLYVKHPMDVFHLNFSENLKIANSCLKHKKRIIQFSSCEVYGRTVATVARDKLIDPEDPQLATFSEDHSEFILGPVNKHRWIYACAKQMLERVLHAMGLEHGLSYTIIRPFNFIGPKIDYLASETDGVPRVFSFFMDALINGGQIKLVNGGINRRCYTYIDDAVECVTRIVENNGNVCDGQIFNIGSPFNEISIRGMAEKMCTLYEKHFTPSSKTFPPEIVSISAEAFYGKGYEDSDRRIPDISKARKLLGWEPKWLFEDMLLTTMKYYVAESAKKPK